jgi:threonine dehydratase
LLEDFPDLEVLAIPVGGGGLAAGMGTIARDINPEIRLVGVEAELFPSMYNLLEQKYLAVGGDTLAEGIAVFEPGKFTSHVLKGLLDDFLLVSETQLETALATLLQIEKTVVEGAGAAGLAAVMGHRKMFEGKKVGIVLTGGNIDTRLLANVLLRDLARSGRLARLRLQMQDRPGSLFKVAKIFDDHNVNIIEVWHQRIFTTLPAKGLVTDIECEARDREQLDGLVAGLKSAGYSVDQVELN